MVFGFEKLGWKGKQTLFIIAIGITGLYLFDFTMAMVSWIVDFKLEDFTLISVRNILGFIFLGFSISLYLSQVDYKEISFIGWQPTYYLFLAVSIISGLYIAELTNDLVLEWVNLQFVDFVSVKNFLGAILLVIAYKLYKGIRP